MRRPAASLPLAVWAGALCASTVLGTTAVAAVGLALLEGVGAVVDEALAAGAVAGLLLSSLGVLAGGRLGVAVRTLHAEAARCLDDRRPGLTEEDRPPVVRLTRELAELAQLLDALHLRVRVADELGERHRRDAEQTAAGVQELLAGLVTAEEGARGQLAAELHDTVAQSLLIASALLAESPVDVLRLRDHVEDAEEQLRAVMARARPPALRDGDLAAAVDALRADMRARYALEVHLTWPDVAAPLPLPSAITLYRFFQEALLNVVKHADVDDAHAELRLEVDAFVASVRDDGPGFEPDEVTPERGRHVGLGLLSERARLSGGWLEVMSGSGCGTVLQLRLPRRAAVPALVPVPAAHAPASGHTPASGDVAPVHVPAQRAAGVAPLSPH